MNDDFDQQQPSDETDPHSGKTSERHIGFAARLRAYFFAGILITAPISITFYLAWLFVTFVDSKVTPLIPDKYNPAEYLPFGLPGLGLVIVLVVLTLIGALTAGFFGRMIMRFYEGLLAQMPVVRNVYGAIKQIIETVLAQQSTAFRQAVLIEYPRRGLWAIAFITGRTKGEVDKLTEADTVNVFLPTTPNPTSGFLLFVPKEDVVPLAMPVEEAIKMVIAAGIVTAPDRSAVAGEPETKLLAMENGIAEDDRADAVEPTAENHEHDRR